MARMMAFIDGENLVMRYQDMVKRGKAPKPHPEMLHLQDVCLWHPGSFKPQTHDVIRATYYTYVVGDDPKVAEVEDAIKQLGFQSNLGTQRVFTLYPKVFKKPRGCKAKGVDIQMTVDILTHTYQDNVDVIYLLSGDGDYIPLIEEVMRMGKQVYVAAFSSGLNSKLKTVADEFALLDEIYFEN
ncbi:MAG: NYN domain-containing protein [Dehalococcoidia bacterium]